MPTNNVTTYLTYASLQMAAEAIFPEWFTSGAIDATWLMEGNGRSTKFTPTQAAQFATEWRVAAYRANTATGFSGTLFECLVDDPARGLVRGQMVMSFRSTEFIDDNIRDNAATNKLEIAEGGWAIGQIADMERWFRDVDSDPAKLQGKSFTVTGYSLGGNLATAFNFLHANTGRISATYTFNGAGVGSVRGGTSQASLRAVVDQFESLRADASAVFVGTLAQGVYAQLRSQYAGGLLRTSAADMAAIDAQLDDLTHNAPGGLFPVVDAASRDLLIRALSRIKELMAEAGRIGGFQSGSAQDPLHPVTTNVDAANLDYQIAVLLSQRDTFNEGGVVGGAIQAVSGRFPGFPSIPNMFDIYGDTSLSAVANSQLHYGQATPVFIEDQPLARGTVVGDAIAASWAYQGVKLLVNEFSRNDFGDSHSLVLIVDSLSLQDALAKLDPNVSTAVLSSILQAASKAKKDTVLGSQGLAEGDVLENALDALRRIFSDPAASATTSSMVGGTWADPAARATFHQRLKDLVDSPAFVSLQGRVVVRLSDSSTLKSAARNDFAAFLALQSLSPVTLTAVAGQASAVEGALAGGANTATFAAWSADRALTVAQREAGAGNFSDRYYADRADLLGAVLKRNQGNEQGPLFSAAMLGLSIQEQTLFTDNASQVQLIVGGTVTPTDPSIRKQIWFGNDLSESFTGSDRGDRLYGGGNNDSLRGLAGADWLEGNTGDDSLDGGAGNDNLLGGAGADTLDGGADEDLLLGGAGDDRYVFNGNWGIDTVDDRDGSIRVDGNALPQLKRVGAGVYRDASGTVTATLVPGRTGEKDLVLTFAQSTGHAQDKIILRNWRPGELGLTPDEQIALQPTDHTVTGDDVANELSWASGGAGAGIDTGTLIGLGGNDTLKGWEDGVGAQLRTPPADYTQFGDELDGGLGDDVLLAGEGHDVLNGGAGNDYLLGGTREYEPGWWAAYGLNESQPELFINASFGAARRNADWNVMDGGDGQDLIDGGWGSDVASGGNDNDVIAGLSGDDSIFGDGGNDELWGDGGAVYQMGQAYFDAINAELGLPSVPVATQYNQWYVPGYLHGRDFLDGGSGNDLIGGSGNDDILLGGGGDDSLRGDGAFVGTVFERRVNEPFEIRGDDWLEGGAGLDSMIGDAGNDTLLGGVDNDSLWGDDDQRYLPIEHHGTDLLDGEGGNDQLVGGGNADTLYGGDGDDRMLGDEVQTRVATSAHGDDELYGGAGNDLMVGGGGGDMLEGGDGNDQLQGDDLVSNLTASAHGDDFLDGGAGDDRLYGNGGTDYLAGGDGNDWLAGEEQEAVNATSTLQGNDTLFGGAGNDTLVGGNGADVIEGDSGTDYQAGGDGNDLYLLQAGDGEVVGGMVETIDDSQGSNTIRFGAGVTLAGVHVATTGNPQDLAISYTSTDAVGVRNGLGGAMTRFEFADGTNVTHSELIGRAADGVIAGTDATGAFTVMGGRTNDSATVSAAGAVISGGRGDDAFVATGGGHTYKYSRGDGQDSITETRNVDPVTGLPVAASRIVFGSDIQSGEVALTADNGLALRIGTNAGDTIRLANFDPQNALDPLPAVDRFEFADGTALTMAELLARGFDFAGTSGNDSIVGTSVADRFAGSEGDDTLSGGGGADVYHLTSASDQDVIVDSPPTGDADDTLRVSVGTQPSDATFLRSGADLVVRDATGTNRVIIQGHYAGGGIERVEFGDGSVWSRADIDAHLSTELTDASEVFTGTSGNDVILARGGNDSVSGVAGDDFIDGGTGNDTLRGGDGGDSLIGGSGTDYLYGDAGADVLDGRGDALTDNMLGGSGSDTYLFGRGSGVDWVYDAGDAGTTDRVRIDVGVTPSDVTVSSDGYYFELGIDGTADRLRLTDAAALGNAHIERIEFADGTGWDEAAIRGRYFAGLMTAGNDSITGWHHTDDDIDGGAGIDTLYGLGGNDVLRNGEAMYGGAGSDTYVFTGWTQAMITESAEATPHVDALVLPSGVTVGEVSRANVFSDDLVLAKSGTSATIIVSQFFSTPSAGMQMEEVRFSDGTVWTPAQLYAQRVATTEGNDSAIYGVAWNETLDGLGGDDRIWGRGGSDLIVGGNGHDALYGDSASTVGTGDGNDTLDGGAGTDTMYGAGGNDTYRFGRGKGADAIVEAAGADRVLLDAGVLATDVTLHRLGSDLVLAIDQGPTQLKVTGHFSATASQIESVEFADGMLWDAAAIQARTIYGTPNAMTGTAGNDVFVVDHESDTITEAANSGIDTVQSSILQYTLGSNLENLVLTGFLNLNGYGNTLDNALTGNGGHNLLVGGAGADTLTGGAGDDSLHGNNFGSGDDGSVDLLRGGLGDDVYYTATGSTAADQIVESVGEGIDAVQLIADGPLFTLPANVENLTVASHTYLYPSSLYGNALDNVITGDLNRAGYVIDGGAGADTLLGSALGATYYVDNPGDRILGTRGSVFSSIDWSLGTGLTTLTLTGSTAISGIGNSGANTIDGSQNTAANTLSGGLGDDTYRLGTGDAVVEAAAAGYDTVVFVGPTATYMAGFANVESAQLDDATGASSLLGGAGEDRLLGNGYGNVLQGQGGADYIVDQVGSFGWSDSDVLDGGAGDDTLVSGSGSDTLIGGLGNDYFDVRAATSAAVVRFGTGSGRDILASQSATARVVVDAGIEPHQLELSRNGADLILSLNAGQDAVTVSGFFIDSVSTQPSGKLGAVEFADGTTLSPTLLVMRLATGNASVGTAAADLLIGAPAGDALDGQGGDDLVWGRGGNDTLLGGAGNDSIEGGAGVDQITGGADNDTLRGGEGADTLNFGRGDGRDTVADGNDDTIAFGPGISSTDLVLSRSGSDLIIALSGSTDQITVTGFMSLANQVGLRFTDGSTMSAAAILDAVSTISGTAGPDNLVGSDLNDRLLGLASNDTLVGNDTLDGGAGTDSMTGGAGDDVYVIDATADIVVESSGGGMDTVQTSVTLATLANNVENLTLSGTSAINGTGNTLANWITGNGAANALNGGAGADTLLGGAGNDTYTVDNTGDVIIELAGEGIDGVTSSVSYTLPAEVENLAMSGTSGLTATGNVLDNMLTGNSGANRLTGGAGNDTLDGGSGNDTMVGGTGNDTYYVNVSTDVVTEVAGEGTDTIFSSVTLTLGTSDVENLTLTGTSTLNATGNGLSNVLIGNSANNTLTGNGGNDTLDGGAGTDSMVGGAGDDTYYVERTADVVTETASNGTDTIITLVTLASLAANVEHLTLGGNAILNGTGNTLANTLTGNSAVNTLAGLAGNDTYIGGGGNDTLNDNSTTSNDIYRWGIGQGNDTITDAGGTADRIEIGAGVTSSQVVLTRSGNNLQVSITGASDVLTVTNWYVGTANRIEEIRLADGSVINTGTAAPASLVTGAGALETLQMRRMTRLPVSLGQSVGAVSDPGSVRSVHLLSQAMAQFIAGAEATRDAGWIVRRPEPMRVDLAAY